MLARFRAGVASASAFAVALVSPKVIAATLPHSVFDVTAYGAKGDGEANDAVAMLESAVYVFHPLRTNHVHSGTWKSLCPCPFAIGRLFVVAVEKCLWLDE